MIFNRLEPRSIPVSASFIVIPPTILSTLLFPHCTSILAAIGTSFLAYLSALVTSVVLYRVSPLHPLASYPGPLMCKITKLWLAGIAMRGKQHVYYRDLHRRYGDVVRVGM